MHTSELSQVFTKEKFESAFKAFLIQADENYVTKKSFGGRTPYGFSERPNLDGAEIVIHYGQGAASKTPYLNWWVVSIYYLPDSGNIIMGIEEKRYPYLNKMDIKPERFERIGAKKEDVAVFYATTKDGINYIDLYNKFMDVCEEVIRLGLK